MGKRLASLLSAPPPTRIGNFGDPKPTKLERAAEAREAMRKVQDEWRKEHAQVVGWSGADCDEAQEIAGDIEHLSRLLARAERKLGEQAQTG